MGAASTAGSVRMRDGPQVSRWVKTERHGYDLKNVPQPDCLLFVQPEYGGRVRIDAARLYRRGPDLVAEVAVQQRRASDQKAKLEAYRRNGVREYVVWRVFDRRMTRW